MHFASSGGQSRPLKILVVMSLNKSNNQNCFGCFSLGSISYPKMVGHEKSTGR